jgi:hypothetical protein
MITPAIRLAAAAQRIDRSGGVEGEHHKEWVLNRVVRILLGTKGHRAWVAARAADGYDWPEGIAP